MGKLNFSLSIWSEFILAGQQADEFFDVRSGLWIARHGAHSPFINIYDYIFDKFLCNSEMLIIIKPLILQ